ncbi:RNA polymerase sigma-70 factor [uncultured Acetobacteroides sp.]|uniref:RNA polymerase sigma-70 factor n=1 Tax=uncultured Acetobacteroides sp. TaxID=1760811 RepID=UPI0029F5CA12|nr:RNA polymerase sigma-70 factor [uncultured Acetobacteroides sp.]
MNDTLNHFCRELQHGNQRLFNQLFADYYVNLCRFAYTYLKDNDTSEEIVQEVFINLWEQRDRLTINTSIRSFLYTSVKNRALNHIRNSKTRLHHEDEFAQEQASKVGHIINFCEREELSHLIDTAVAELPEQCRTIFDLSRNQNLTYNEIAQQLNISPKTVENQMGIALKKLRAKLSPYLSSIIAFF